MPNKKFTVYHNPRCTKSRCALEILEEKKATIEVVEYLKTPLDVESLRSLVKKLGVPAKQILRTKEPEFASLSLDVDNEEAVLKAIAKEPKLMERPIVVCGNQAVIGRPPENVLGLL